jgi:hypothetical protein
MRKTTLTTRIIIFLFVIVILGYHRPVTAQNFGVTTTGTTNYPTATSGHTALCGSNAEAQGTLSAQMMTIPAGGATVQSVTIYWVSIGSGGQFQFALYNDDGSGNPSSLVAGSQLGPVSAVAGYQTLTYSTPLFLSGGTYWLARQVQNNQPHRSYDLHGGPGRRSRSYSWTSGVFPDPYGGPTTSDDLLETEYITYVQIKGYAKATKAALPINTNISSVSFYAHAAGNFRVAIYNNSGTVPGTKQWESNSTTATAGTWNTVNISAGTPSTLTLTGGTYWLVWQWDAVTAGPSYTAGSSGDGNYIALTYGAFPATWSGGTSTAEKWSIYGTYCPAPPGTTGATICGGNTATLSASGAVSGDKYRWYDASTGGTLLKESSDYTDNTYTTPVLTTTTNYWVSIINSTGCESGRTQVTATVNPLPSAGVSGTTNVSCYAGSDGTITVNATGGTSPYYYSIYNGGTTYVFDANNPHTFIDLQANYEYKIRVKDSNGCESPAIP